MIDMFPIKMPDALGGVEMRMIYVFTYQGQSHYSCMRDLTQAEHEWLCANWPAYLDQRTAWLAWARVNLLPAFQPGSGWQHVSKQGHINRILDFQT